MATEHELKLKATLDTSEVRREIERLNSSRGSQRSGVSASSPNATFSRLSTTLSRLDMTLSKLLAAVQSMSRISNVNPAAPMSASSSAVAPLALAAFSQRAAQNGISLKNDQLGKIVLKSYGHLPYDFNNSNQIWFDRLSYDRDIGIEHGRRLMMTQDEIFSKLASGYAKFADMSEADLRSFLHMDVKKSKLGDVSGKISTLLGFAKLYGAHQQLVQAAGHEASPWEALGMNVSIASAAGMAAGGPLGALAGATGAGLYTAIQTFTRLLNDSNASLREWNDDVSRAAQYKDARKSFFMRGRLEEATGDIQEGDFTRFDKLRKELEAQQERLQQMLSEQDKSARHGRVAANALQMQSQLQETQSMLKQLDDAKQRLRDKQEAEKQQAEQNEQSRVQLLSQARSRWDWQQYISGNLQDKGVLQTELAIAKRSMSTAQTAGEFAQAAADVSMLQSAIESLSEAAQKSAEAAAKAWLQEDASSQMSFLREQLSRLVRPDFSNVQSLGQYGAYMGEKRADVQSQTLDYLKTQTDLQQQMKQILDSKSFSAAYS